MSKINLEKRFQNLVDNVLEYDPSADINQIKKAWNFTKLAHTGQVRLSGGPYAAHPLDVALRLSEWKLDTTSIIAALLHDSIEEGGATRDDLVKGFGEEVAFLVDGVTKVTDLRLKGSKEAEFVESLRKMLLVMAKDLRVVLIKLADRLHNLKTMYAIPREGQLKNALETLDVYAPLAERLGMGDVKGELEDLSFKYAYSEDYDELVKNSKIYFEEAEQDILKMKKVLLKAFLKEGIKVEIQGRQKHLYSLWRKLQRPEIDWDYERIHDIVALRIIVDKISECYGALGIVHAQYRPVPHIGVSDFIAQPKPNGYRSIHTKVFGPGGRIVEVQIRTQKMHEQAESGIAAHWAYSDQKGKNASDKILERGDIEVNPEKINWVKQLVDWQKEMNDSEEFLRAVKFDAFKHRNFIFSPEGDVYDLPAGATPVDFAYAVHTNLGNYLSQAKVDGRIVPLDYKLQSGQVVEILKTKNPKGPSSGWLDFVVTTLARREINRYLRSDKALR